MSPPPFLLPGQGQSEEFFPNLSSAAGGLPRPAALGFAPLQLPVSAEEEQLCAGTLAALPDCQLVLEPGASVQRRGLAEELLPEGLVQESRKPGQLFPGPRLLHVSVGVWLSSVMPLVIIAVRKTRKLLFINIYLNFKGPTEDG